MASYTTPTSDKSKLEALSWWRRGIFGFLGLEYFYVGKVKVGAIRSIIGSFLLLGMLSNIISSAKMGLSGILAWLLLTVIIWAISAMPNYYRIKIGVFRDNVGLPLRN